MSTKNGNKNRGANNPAAQVLMGCKAYGFQTYMHTTNRTIAEKAKKAAAKESNQRKDTNV